MAVYYSTDGTGGPWTLLAQHYADAYPQALWEANLRISLPAAVDNRSNFAVMFKSQSNNSTDSIYLDNVNLIDIALPAPGPSSDPDPADDSVLAEIPLQVRWTPGPSGASQKLYLSDNPSDVSTRASGALKLTDTTGTQSSYSPSGLQKNIIYYWCVDTFALGESCNTQGEIWIFLTPQRGDFDLDDDVDQEDFGVFQSCLSGSGRRYQAGCEKADFDGDNDVDANDFGVFRNCMGGPKAPPNC
jgi:hypothetical protein